MTQAPRIIAIGGGSIRRGRVTDIDRRVIQLSGKRRPNVLFIPTASGDSEDYVAAFTRVYGEKLGGRIAAMRLLTDRPSARGRARMVADADVIYVGGGNTYRMMKLWRRLGVDRLLLRAARRGAVLAGSSAGGICWFRHGHSDSRCRPDRDWDYIRVAGLGLIDAMFCPHYHAEGREASLHRMILRHGGMTVACDNDAAIEIIGDGSRVLTGTTRAKAYRLFRRAGGVVVERLRVTDRPAPLNALLTRG